MHDLNVLDDRDMGRFTMTLGWVFGRIQALDEQVARYAVTNNTTVVTTEEEPKKPRFLGDTEGQEA